MGHTEITVEGKPLNVYLDDIDTAQQIVNTQCVTEPTMLLGKLITPRVPKSSRFTRCRSRVVAEIPAEEPVKTVLTGVYLMDKQNKRLKEALLLCGDVPRWQILVAATIIPQFTTTNLCERLNTVIGTTKFLVKDISATLAFGMKSTDLPILLARAQPEGLRGSRAPFIYRHKADLKNIPLTDLHGLLQGKITARAFVRSYDIPATIEEPKAETPLGTMKEQIIAATSTAVKTLGVLLSGEDLSVDTCLEKLRAMHTEKKASLITKATVRGVISKVCTSDLRYLVDIVKKSNPKSNYKITWVKFKYPDAGITLPSLHALFNTRWDINDLLKKYPTLQGKIQPILDAESLEAQTKPKEKAQAEPKVKVKAEPKVKAQAEPKMPMALVAQDNPLPPVLPYVKQRSSELTLGQLVNTAIHNGTRFSISIG